MNFYDYVERLVNDGLMIDFGKTKILLDENFEIITFIECGDTFEKIERSYNYTFDKSETVKNFFWYLEDLGVDTSEITLTVKTENENFEIVYISDMSDFTIEELISNGDIKAL